MKLLLLVVVLALAYVIVKAYKRKNRRATRDPSKTGAEDMVRCAQCGVHLPRSESLMSDQVFYCSAEHRGLHEKTD